MNKENELKFDEAKHSKELTFDEKKHEYTSNGKKLISVTQLVNKFTETFDSDAILDRMFQNNQGEKLYIGKSRKYVGMTKQEIKDLWKINSKSKSRYGTFIHEMAENIANGFDPGIKLPELNQVKKLLKDFEVVDTELKIFDADIGIAGTVDLLLKKDGLYYIYDWKTNQSKDLEAREDRYKKTLLPPLQGVPNTKFWIYSLQLSIYRYLLQKQHPEWEFGDNALVHLINGVADLKTDKGRIYPEMTRAASKTIVTPYMKSEVEIMFKTLKTLEVKE